MKAILFGNSLMLLGIAIINLVDLGLMYAGMIWISYVLLGVGFLMAVISVIEGWILKKR